MARAVMVGRHSAILLYHLSNISCFLVRSGPSKLLHAPSHGMMDPAVTPLSCWGPVAHLTSLSHERTRYDRKRTEPHCTHGEAQQTTDDRTAQGQSLHVQQHLSIMRAVASTKQECRTWLSEGPATKNLPALLDDSCIISDQ